MKIDGLNKLQSAIKKLQHKAKEAEATVQVGFTQKYATVVHENLGSYHKIGQAKFLESPARSLQAELRRIITTTFKQTGSMRQALLMAGYRLQREAQLLTPVDTSALKASAYTAMETDANAVATAAYEKSEQIRQAVLTSRSKTK